MKTFFITLILCFTIASYTHAAVVSLSADPQAAVGTRITVDVIADLEGENVNSVDISVAFPTSLLKWGGYDKESGVIPLWVTTPTESAGVIHFSGVIPGGIDRLYDPEHPEKRGLTLARLFFQTTAPGTAALTLPTAMLLRNDGKGTSIAVRTTPVSVTLVAREGVIPTTADTTPPGPFTVSIVERSHFGRTPRLAVFSAEDIEAGIEHYEVQISSGTWHRTESPYPLPYRPFSYTLTVRAFDFSGNYHDESITIPGQHPSQVLFFSVLLILIIVFFVYRRKHVHA